MSGYVLSLDAEEDLQDIYLYSEETWGPEQAARYLQELFETFGHIGRNPHMGRSRPELGSDLRSLPHVAHVIFYMEWRGEVAILRVLHGSRDTGGLFADHDPRAGLNDDGTS
ncbi:type II toxin-antitoxin system RelE/ParE family toxin [Oricola sp.]|uniref:type II toxin-antitoxin system RelE/ParE family toxin n=1 Tax=Oricola sp. TaxID=1979950 RepID=UPI0025F94EAA|nr:type II toxin-antitoxin system RelE/ParE family toxin [Oricola sp.]MCI5077610.1 type II toxin-antitoxin system RelE/ParE family toxin [Oricola sp.]